MMLKLGVLLVTSVSVLTGVAHAADKAPPMFKAPVAAIPFSWTGFYIGAHAGGAVGVATSSNVAPFGGFDQAEFTTLTNVPRGAIFGGQLGFNWQAGPVVFGLEGELGHLDLRTSSTRDDDFAEVRAGWYGTATGRIGYAFNRTLFYVKGGGAWTRLENVATDLDGGIADPLDVTRLSRTHFGWTLGGGVEHAFASAPNWSVKAEYMYTDFRTDRSANLSGEFFDHRNEIHTVKLGVNYRPSWFGPVASAPAPLPVYNWTGFYIGAHGGGALADSSSIGSDDAFDQGPTRLNLAPRGFLGGAQAGYNVQAGWAVFGIEAEVGYLGDLRKEVVTSDDFMSVRYGWYSTLTGRLGVALGNTLVYAKAGGAWARIENVAGDLDGAALLPDATDFTNVSKTHSGLALGGGIEHAFAPNWSLKAEYLYLNFDDVISTNLDGETYRHRNDVHTAKLGINYRFGAAAPVVARY
jgi:outer membrane immunogenic protein